MCVCIQDIQRILDEEKQDKEAGGWKQVSKTDLSETWRKSDETHSVQLVKVSEYLLVNTILFVLRKINDNLRGGDERMFMLLGMLLLAHTKDRVTPYE